MHHNRERPPDEVRFRRNDLQFQRIIFVEYCGSSLNKFFSRKQPHLLRVNLVNISLHTHEKLYNFFLRIWPGGIPNGNSQSLVYGKGVRFDIRFESDK